MKHKPLSLEEKVWLDSLAVELNRHPCAVPWLTAEVYMMVCRRLMEARLTPHEASITIRAMNGDVEETVRQHVSFLANNPSRN